jgi:hypothetical protein
MPQLALNFRGLTEARELEASLIAEKEGTMRSSWRNPSQRPAIATRGEFSKAASVPLWRTVGVGARSRR